MNYKETMKMDKKIKKIQQTNKKESKQLSNLLKADKKQDKKIDKGKMMKMKQIRNGMQKIAIVVFVNF